jgi:hypothetical protein
MAGAWDRYSESQDARGSVSACSSVSFFLRWSSNDDSRHAFYKKASQKWRLAFDKLFDDMLRAEFRKC